MSEDTVNLRNKRLRRTVVASVIVLALTVLGGLVFRVIERIRDAADRAH